MNWQEATDWIWENHYCHTRSKAPVRSILDEAAVMLAGPLDNVDRPRLRLYLDVLKNGGAKPATLRRKLGVVMKTLRELYAEGLIVKLPVAPSLPASGRGRQRVLTEHEERALAHYLRGQRDEWAADLVLFMVDTGLRLSEALGLTWEDVRPSNTVHVAESKNGDQRILPLTEKALRAMQRRRRANGRGPWVGYRPWEFQRAWNRARRHMGLEIDREFVPHALRHTFASRLVSRGAELHEVQKLLGHRDIRSTLIYAHLSPERLRSTIALLETT